VLKWEDVDWERDRFRVDSPKTGARWVPIFPELRPYLADVFDLAGEGAVHVITRYREKNSNLRTQFLRIIKRAGVERWVRLFHNLRGSRQTELADTFPAHVVSKWLGNTVEVAAAHYLQTTEEHFRRAAYGAAELGGSSGMERKGAEGESEKAAELAGVKRRVPPPHPEDTVP
jgi:integrase